jgi:hypothetical protein
MNAKIEVYIVRFESRGIGAHSGERYLPLRNTYALIFHSASPGVIFEAIEDFRFQEEAALQSVNGCRVETRARIISRSNVIQIIEV